MTCKLPSISEANCVLGTATFFDTGGAPQAIGEYIAGDDALDKTLKGGLYPFIAGDIMKLYLAALALPSAWAMVNKFKGRR